MQPGAQRLANGVITLLIAAATLLAAIAFVLADPLARYLLVPDAARSTQDLTAELMRIMLPTVIIFGVSGLMMGVLNAHQRFLTPALAPSLYNVGLIFGALVLARNDNVHGLAWGAVIGAALHMLVQIPDLLRVSFRYRPALSLNIPGVREVLVLMGPRVLGLGIVQVNFWVNTALASGMVAGSVTALSTAFVLMMTVLGVVGRSVGTAVFPDALDAQRAARCRSIPPHVVRRAAQRVIPLDPGRDRAGGGQPAGDRGAVRARRMDAHGYRRHGLGAGTVQRRAGGAQRA